MSVFNCCPTGVNHHQGASATRSPQKTCGAALGIILMIGGGVAAGVLYSYLGYVALACLAAVPIGLAITCCSCRKTGVVVGEAILKDTSKPWNERLATYFSIFLTSNNIQSCKICVQLNDNQGINVPGDFTISARHNIRDKVAWITRTIQNVKNSGPFNLTWAIITKSQQDISLLNCHLFIMTIFADGTIAMEKHPPVDYSIYMLHAEFKRVGITRLETHFATHLADI